MEDDLAAADGVVDALVALDVALDQLDVVAELGEVLAPAGGEVVEHAHLVAVVEQALDEVRADEPAAAGDERPHGAHFESAFIDGEAAQLEELAGAPSEPWLV